MKKLRLTIAIVAALTALALPMTASANSGQDGYGGPNSAVAGVSSNGGGNGPTSGSPSASPSATSAATATQAPTVGSTAVESSGSSLPFTGLDLGYIAAAGILLLGTGFVLRRVTNRHESF